jgi:hypothetical protein
MPFKKISLGNGDHIFFSKEYKLVGMVNDSCIIVDWPIGHKYLVYTKPGTDWHESGYAFKLSSGFGQRKFHFAGDLNLIPDILAVIRAKEARDE